MRVLVCGSRSLEDERPIFDVLTGIHEGIGIDVLIQGGAKGADRIAAYWADRNDDVEHHEYPADWTLHGKGAGPIRNELMLRDGKPDVVWAFVDKPLQYSKGTADMVRRARNAQVPTYVVEVIPTRG
jgi:hypothetical protein